MKNKPIIIVLAILFVLSTAASAIGYLNHGKQTKPEVKPQEKKELVSYEYYVEDVLVTEAPINTEEEPYIFNNAECDNNMSIDFDSENWTFTTNNKTKGTCKLYFNKGTYNVILTTANGLINDEDTSYTFTVDRLSDGQFKVVPNEGYDFKEVSCANDKEAIYDKSTNTLNINSITENIACKIDFELKNLVVEIDVKNGEGKTTLNSKYGESVSAVVTPKDGYEKPKITCTNNQENTYENNKFVIAKLTDNTKCTIEFEKAPTITYNLRIDNLPEQVTITSGNKEQSVVSGKDGKFSLKVDEGYQVKIDCNGIKPSDEKIDPDGTITYTFLGITKNITCNITTEPIN